MNKPGIPELLASFRDALQNLPNEWWSKERIESLLLEYCRAADIKPSKLIRPLRVATTGSSVGFGLFEGISILGKQKTIQRISKTLCTIPNSMPSNC